MLDTVLHGCRITSDENGRFFAHDLDGSPLGEFDTQEEAFRAAKRRRFGSSAETSPVPDPLASEPKPRRKRQKE